MTNFIYLLKFEKYIKYINFILNININCNPIDEYAIPKTIPARS